MTTILTANTKLSGDTNLACDNMSHSGARRASLRWLRFHTFTAFDVLTYLAARFGSCPQRAIFLISES